MRLKFLYKWKTGHHASLRQEHKMFRFLRQRINVSLSSSFNMIYVAHFSINFIFYHDRIFVLLFSFDTLSLQRIILKKNNKTYNYFNILLIYWNIWNRITVTWERINLLLQFDTIRKCSKNTIFSNISDQATLKSHEISDA